MAGDDPQDERGFTIIDRRGREDEPAPEPEGAEGGGAGPRAEGGEALPRIDFATFVLSLSTSALYHLGLVADPETGRPGEVNLPLARQTVDTLEMLEEKTRGNLDEEEAKLLQTLLYELRLRFVESSQSNSKPK